MQLTLQEKSDIPIYTANTDSITFTDLLKEFISDTFFPELVQFGIIGIILYIVLWRFIIKKLYQAYNENGKVQFLKIGLLMIGFIMIESVAGSVFLQGGGICAMIILALIIKNAFIEESPQNA